MTTLEHTASNASLTIEAIIQESNYPVDIVNIAFVAIHALDDLVKLLNESDVPMHRTMSH